MENKDHFILHILFYTMAAAVGMQGAFENIIFKCLPFCIVCNVLKTWW